MGAFTAEIQERALKVLEQLGLFNCGVYGVYYEGQLNLMCCFNVGKSHEYTQHAFPLPFGESNSVVHQLYSDGWESALEHQLRRILDRTHK